jgi:predicted transcriptional regulator
MSDIQTASLFALQEIRPKINTRQRTVLNLLLNHTDMTNTEIAYELHWPVNTVTSLTKELREAGK